MLLLKSSQQSCNLVKRLFNLSTISLQLGEDYWWTDRRNKVGGGVNPGKRRENWIPITAHAEGGALNALVGTISENSRDQIMSYTRLDTDVCATNVSSSVDKRIPLPSPVYASVCDRFKSTSACFEVLFIARCASPRHRETPFPNPRLRYAASFAGAGRLPWQVSNRLGVV